MNLAVSRRGFLTAVAAGVTAALAPSDPIISDALGRAAARSRAYLDYKAFAVDTVVPLNGTMMMWEQMLRDFIEAEMIGAQVTALDIVLDAEAP